MPYQYDNDLVRDMLLGQRSVYMRPLIGTLGSDAAPPHTELHVGTDEAALRKATLHRFLYLDKDEQTTGFLQAEYFENLVKALTVAFNGKLQATMAQLVAGGSLKNYQCVLDFCTAVGRSVAETGTLDASRVRVSVSHARTAEARFFYLKLVRGDASKLVVKGDEAKTKALKQAYRIAVIIQTIYPMEAERAATTTLPVHQIRGWSK